MRGAETSPPRPRRPPAIQTSRQRQSENKSATQAFAFWANGAVAPPAPSVSQMGGKPPAWRSFSRRSTEVFLRWGEAALYQDAARRCADKRDEGRPLPQYCHAGPPAPACRFTHAFFGCPLRTAFCVSTSRQTRRQRFGKKQAEAICTPAARLSRYAGVSYAAARRQDSPREVSLAAALASIILCLARRIFRYSGR